VQLLFSLVVAPILVLRTSAAAAGKEQAGCGTKLLSMPLLTPTLSAQGLKWQARAGALALLGQLAKRAPGVSGTVGCISACAPLALALAASRCWELGQRWLRRRLAWAVAFSKQALQFCSRCNLQLICMLLCTIPWVCCARPAHCYPSNCCTPLTPPRCACCAVQEFAHCMVAVVPRVSECMVDIRQEVRVHFRLAQGRRFCLLMACKDYVPRGALSLPAPVSRLVPHTSCYQSHCWPMRIAYCFRAGGRCGNRGHAGGMRHCWQPRFGAPHPCSGAPPWSRCMGPACTVELQVH